MEAVSRRQFEEKDKLKQAHKPPLSGIFGSNILTNGIFLMIIMKQEGMA